MDYEFVTAPGEFVTGHGEFATANGEFVTGHGEFVTAHSKFVTVHENVVTLHGEFVTVWLLPANWVVTEANIWVPITSDILFKFEVSSISFYKPLVSLLTRCWGKLLATKFSLVVFHLAPAASNCSCNFHQHFLLREGCPYSRHISN